MVVAEDFSCEVLAILEQFTSLAHLLEQCAHDLQGAGVPPSDEIVAAIKGAQIAFNEVRDNALIQARELGLSADFIGIPGCIDDLQKVLSANDAAINRAHERNVTYRSVMATLEAVMSITYLDGVLFEPLKVVWKTAKDLIDIMHYSGCDELPREARTLTTGEHPLSRLLALLSDSESLSDEEMEVFLDSVREAFGTALYLAVVRHKIIIGGDKISTSGGETASLESQERVFPHEPEQLETSTGESLDFPLPATDELPHSEPHKNFDETGESPRAERSSELRIKETSGYQPRKEASAEISSLEEPGNGRTVSESDIEEVRSSIVSTPSARPDTSGSISTEGQLIYSSDQQDTSTILARRILIDGLPQCGEVLSDLIWRLIYEKRAALAYHISRTLELEESELQPPLHSAFLQSLVLAPHTRHNTGEIARLLLEAFSGFGDRCFIHGKRFHNQAVRFLIAASALRPALLAPATGASAVLRGLYFGDGLGKLFDYCKTLADLGEGLQGLDPGALKTVRGEVAWQTEMDKFLADVAAFCAQAPRMTMAFARASDVWRKWQEPDELIGALLQPVRQNNPARLDSIKGEVARLSDEAEVRRQVAICERRLVGRRGSDPIVAKSLGQLLQHARKAIGYAQRWIELVESHPKGTRDYKQKLAEKLRGVVRDSHRAVVAEVHTFADGSSPLPIKASANYCLASLEDIRTLFDPMVTHAFEETAARHVVGADLLKIPDLPLDEQWEPCGIAPADIRKAILNFLASGMNDWQHAFDEHASRRDHQITAWIIDHLRSASRDVSIMTQNREKHLAECRDALQRDSDETKSRVEDAVVLGLLSGMERDDLIARVEHVSFAADDALRFLPMHSMLAGIRTDIEKRRRMEAERVEQRVETSQIAFKSPHDVGRIRKALDNGDVLTANEYIDMVLNGQPLPEDGEVQRDVFLDFFCRKYLALDEFLASDSFRDRQYIQQIIRGVEQGHGFGPITMKRVPGAQAKQAADLLRAWFTSKQTGKINDELAKLILSHLGFNVQQAAVVKDMGRVWIDVFTEPIGDRNYCPVAAYGSLAGGRYRVLCVWERPAEEELLNQVGETIHKHPVLVFHFGRMTEKRRRDLARLCRERRRAFLLVDDSLVFYLCGERGSRLPILFDCALPFSFNEPYTTTASLVPTEMFYGRMRERDSIISRTGSCFIYGGRQLGKTALLRDVERTFHAPDQKRIALWIDLKAEGIGYDRPADEIWQVLGVCLKNFGIFSGELPSHKGDIKLLEHIGRWLDEDQERRILLLLDEADRFLELDSKAEFVRSARFKGVMDRTDKRFKVVFAGLHNVQRTTRQGNHPLAHYGDPICIGPLLGDGEWREARALVEKPLRSLGYRFETSDLVTRILSQTNYYPSLIQLYCNELLQHVQGPSAAQFDPRTSPPYVITSKHVEDAYRSQELRNNIKHRFDLTLQLDQRYEVIALLIAYGCLGEESLGMTEGFSVSWVRSEALEWWPEGFQGASEDFVRVLLDEMIGLGILRAVGPRYALRSPNVLALMGMRGEIQKAILKSREVPPEYEPSTFRSSFRAADGSETMRRSPLTAQQESELRLGTNGVSMIFGCRAAGLDDLEPRLRDVFGKRHFIAVDELQDPMAFARRLEELVDRRDKEGTTLILVPSDLPWTERWVIEALGRVEKLKSKTSFVQVAFAADPAQAWIWAADKGTGLEGLKDRGLRIFSLEPWHDAALRQWLEDCKLPNEPSVRQKISTITGNWPFLLHRFHEDCRRSLHHWERRLKKLADFAEGGQALGEWAQWLGLERLEPAKVLHTLEVLGCATEDDLIGVVESVPDTIIQRCILWADLLRLAKPCGGGSWRVDPLVGKVLSTKRA